MMTRTDFCKQFAKENGLTQEQSKAICYSVFNLLARSIRKEDMVYIKDFGTFRKKIYHPHKYTNLHTGVVNTTEEKERFVFKPYPHPPEEPINEDEIEYDYE